MKKGIRISVTIIIIVVITGFIFYPKIKPLLKPKAQEQVQAKSQRQQQGQGQGQRQGSGPAKGRQMMRQGGQPVLNASGFVIAPVTMNEIYRCPGNLLPDEEVELSFETSGKIVGIYFSEGTRVKKSQLLAKMNDRHLQAQLLKLQAQKKLSEEKEFRQRSLLGKDAISKESYDQVATELQEMQADILLVKARIAETELRAPFDGIIGLRMLSEGSYATPSTKVVRLVKVSPLKVEFSIPEKYAGVLKPGFPIKFNIDGLSEVFNASVYAIDPKIDIEMRTIVVRALYPNKNEELKPGRYANISIQLVQIDNTIAIPTEALIAEMEGEKVFIYNTGKASSVKVSTGLRTESLIQIQSGLKFGDTLLTTGILQLRQDLPVVLDTLVKN